MHKELIGLSQKLLKTIAPTATHQHYKGGLYRVIGEGIHTETQEELVFYEHVFPTTKLFMLDPRLCFMICWTLRRTGSHL